MRAPRACAPASVSSTTAPAPCDGTKPSRRASKGRLARAGSSLKDRNERASRIIQAWIDGGSRSLLAALTSTASARPARSRSTAVISARLPLAQAPPTVKLGPRSSSRSEASESTSVSPAIIP